MAGLELGEKGFEYLQAFSISLGIGLLMGLERERTPNAPAGLRTFALIALFGSVCALLSQTLGAPWITAAGILMVGAILVAAYLKDEDPGATTVVAALLCCSYGALVWLGHMVVAGMLGVVTTALLYFKAELKSFSQNITRKDLVSVLQFGAVTLIVLPILPNRDMGPYGAFNPYQTWWMVVLISGLSLAGYAALRLFGQSHGAPILGIMGGMASSTATTMVFSKRVAADGAIHRMAVVVILMANLIVLVRLALYAGALEHHLLPLLLPPLALGFLLGIGMALYAWRGLGSVAAASQPQIEVGNPAEIRAALLFGGIYAIVLLITAALQDTAGSRGLFVVALVSGFTDVDAITLSSIRLFGIGKIGAEDAALAIVIAALANLAFKLGLVWFIGGRTLFMPVAGGFALIAAGTVTGVLLQPVISPLIPS